MLAGNYANSPLSADDATTTELYRDELAAMVEKCGQERVAASVRAAIRGCKFLPEISVLWDGIPPAGSRLAWDPNCAVCHGNGWRFVREGPGKPEKATRCNCLALRKVS